MEFDIHITEYGDGVPASSMAILEQATQQEQMIPLSAEVIKSHQKNFVALCMGEVAGYAALANEYGITVDGQQKRAVELGGAVVLPDFRGRGLASALLEKRLELLPQEKSADYAVIFTNERSRGYVDRAGLRPLREGERLSQIAFDLCNGCTRCPQNGEPTPAEDPQTCCDYPGIRVSEL